MALSLKPLDQQVIVITGASSGIGLVTARTAAARGAKVMLVARSEDALRRIVEEITAAGGTAAYQVADVGDAAAMEAAAQATVARFGRVDSWINNAGVAIYAKLLDTPLADHERLIRTNYFGVVNGCAAAVPALAAGGALITVGSIASDVASPIMGVYSASKHAVAAYVEVLRQELEATGAPISVTLIKPSGIDTPIAQHAAVHADGAGRLPPPVYDPQLVADAILDAAVRPRRAITVGGAGRAQELFAAHFPALFDWLAPVAAKSFTDQADQQPRPSNLFEGGVRAGEERSGVQSGRRFSVYTAAARHRPVAGLVALGAIGGGLALAAMGRRRG